MTPSPLHHADEPKSNAVRNDLVRVEPRSLRTFTPTLAVIARSAGVYHWTPEGRRLYDFTSGVLVSNLGHNPSAWMQRFSDHMSWTHTRASQHNDVPKGFFAAVPMTTYNAATPLEIRASQ